ncbi:hypothetical protein ATANTOWER_000409 [Ataeniobius toweri]|uniref:Uncharacterized protein n=1 Tax=Ataeniobius toweri TaxID=208326 RepID=A0ABU7AMJ6_9TELE|nr:hypothetical protein [Ataeniobius toweri]
MHADVSVILPYLLFYFIRTDRQRVVLKALNVPSRMRSSSNYTNRVTPVTHRMTTEAIYAYVIRGSVPYVPYFFSRAVRMSFASPLPGRPVACWLELRFFRPPRAGTG